MHIEAELDDIHTERLLKLQRQLHKTLPELVQEILTQAIDAKFVQPETEGQRIYRLFDEAGLVGCMEGDGTLSTNYKDHLWGEQ
jgi:hypothetical protein